jgi:organic radical activating enzyme
MPLNQQPISKLDVRKDGSLVVKEIFYTIQGEGPYCGEPAIFIRLGGCNVLCPLCFGTAVKSRIPYLSRSFGEKVRLDKVEEGEVILTFDQDMNLVETKVADVIDRVAKKWLEITIDGHTYDVTREHPFFTKRGLVEAQHLEVGDIILEAKPWSGKRVDGKELLDKHNGKEVQKIKRCRGKLSVRNISCAPYNTYLADGMWVHNCDTEYTSDLAVMSTDDIMTTVQRIRKYQAKQHERLIVITGGEPFRQNISPLVRKILSAGLLPQIETNGTLPQSVDWPDYEDFVPIVCSPKAPKISLRSVHLYFKYVIEAGFVSEKDGLPTRVLGADIPNLFRPDQKWPRQKIYVVPCDTGEPTSNKANLAAARDVALKYGYTLGVQLHKICNLP